MFSGLRFSVGGAKGMKMTLGWRALLGGIFVLFGLATCCYSVVKDANAWREVMHDPSCLPEHRCDAL
jgi:hypothetical protein